MQVIRRQIDASKQAEHIDRYQTSCVRVQTVVEEFAQRTAGARSACLLTINAVCNKKRINVRNVDRFVAAAPKTHPMYTLRIY